MLKKRGGSPSPLMNATAREWEGNHQWKALFLFKLWVTVVPHMKVKIQENFFMSNNGNLANPLLQTVPRKEEKEGESR